MKFTPTVLVFIGIFSNFFGTFIVGWYGELIGIGGLSVFDESKAFFDQSLIELSCLFFMILGFYCLIIKRKSKKYIRTIDYTYRGRVSYFFWIISFFLILISFLNILNTGSFDYSNRGAGQFEGRGILTALERAGILLFPIFVCYRLLWSNNLFAKRVSLFFYITSVVYFFSHGNRMMFLLLSLTYLFIKISNFDRVNKKLPTFRIFLFLFLFCVLTTTIYYLRVESYLSVSGLFIFGFIIYLFLDGSIGSIGISYIYPQVKFYVANETGYLNGRSFSNYIFGLFVPSALLYVFSLSEFYFRSSYYFNDLFNTNPNHGYDFMMVADFYWNFGYLGLFLYFILVLFILFFLEKNQLSCLPKKLGPVIILTGFFIIGQRSDFGVFLKNAIYCILIFYLIYYVTPKDKVSLNDNFN